MIAAVAAGSLATAAVLSAHKSATHSASSARPAPPATAKLAPPANHAAAPPQALRTIQLPDASFQGLPRTEGPLAEQLTQYAQALTNPGEHETTALYADDPTLPLKSISRWVS
ncbi:hypothetical protein [Streptomyces sp. NPDC003996]